MLGSVLLSRIQLTVKFHEKRIAGFCVMLSDAYCAHSGSYPFIKEDTCKELSRFFKRKKRSSSGNRSRNASSGNSYAVHYTIESCVFSSHERHKWMNGEVSVEFCWQIFRSCSFFQCSKASLQGPMSFLKTKFDSFEFNIDFKIFRS